MRLIMVELAGRVRWPPLHVLFCPTCRIEPGIRAIYRAFVVRNLDILLLAVLAAIAWAIKYARGG